MSQVQSSLPAPPRRFLWRRLVQFRLRTLLIVTAIAAAGMAWWTHTVWRQRQAVAALREARADVLYDFEHVGGGCFTPPPTPDAPEWMVHLLGVDVFAKVDEVHMPKQTREDQLDLLHELRGLRTLHVDEMQITDAGVAKVCRLAQVAHLHLGNVSRAGLGLLAGDTRIRSLTLGGIDITDADLAQLESLTGLESLTLAGAQITDAGLRHLRPLKSLQALTIDCPQVTDAGLEHLEGLSALGRVLLESSRVTDAGEFRLRIQVPECIVYLQDNRGPEHPRTDADLARLRPACKVEHLSLWKSQVTDAGLARLKGVTSLKRIFLMGSKRFTDAGLAHLKDLVALEDLCLRETNLTDAGLMHLETLASLKDLDLDDTRVTDAGLKHLKGLVALENLYLTGTQVTEAGVSNLQEALPKCRIEWDGPETPDDGETGGAAKSQ